MFNDWLSGGIESPCVVVFELVWYEYFYHGEFQATDVNRLANFLKI